MKLKNRVDWRWRSDWEITKAPSSRNIDMERYLNLMAVHISTTLQVFVVSADMYISVHYVIYKTINLVHLQKCTMFLVGDNKLYPEIYCDTYRSLFHVSSMILVNILYFHRIMISFDSWLPKMILTGRWLCPEVFIVVSRLLFTHVYYDTNNEQ